jgi:hopanoid biosynthesis associated protein HpnK
VHTSNRILIINGDDFGVSPTVNAAVIRAHTEGVLTSASLLVNARASSEAVTVARAYPHLGVGLHITLVREKATLSVEKPSTLVDQTGHFPQNPVIAGLRYFFDSGIKLQLAREIEAQIQKFMATGMTPSHVDGHLNMHMHPTVLTILLPLARKYAIPAFRLPRENLWINLKLCPRNIWSKSLHWFIYFCLCTHAKRTLMTSGIAFPDRFFGLLASGHLD